jgi:hypothetical protein
VKQINVRPLPVKDVLSVFPDVDRSQRLASHYLLVQLLTSEGLLVLKLPQPMARELTESLMQASPLVESDCTWVPEYRSSATAE